MNKVKRKQIYYEGTQEQYIRGDGTLATFPDIPNTSDFPSTYESITYEQLKVKINNLTLVPGTKYRITDYVATTVQQNTVAEGNVFDLVVTAIDKNTLDCKASALLHEGDTYFSSVGADLSKWQIWYDINNDTVKYAWADASKGKGVIYRMIDEWGNECPYDFKSIQFIRKVTNGVIDEDNGSDTPLYTFTIYDKSISQYIDASISVLKYDVNTDQKFIRCIGNVIKPSIDKYSDVSQFMLNENIFLSFLNNVDYVETMNNFLDYCCFNNLLIGSSSNNICSISCCDNTITGHANILGSNCSSNTVKGTANVFGYNSNYNVLNSGCTHNKFGDVTEHITLGQSCRENIFHTECGYITLGNNCDRNIFKEYVGRIIFGNTCTDNIINSNCHWITFGNSDAPGTEGSKCYNITIESGNNYIRVYNTTDTSNSLRNIYIANGCSGTSNSYTEISSITRNRNYRTTVGHDSEGNLRIYNEDDPVEGGSSTEDGDLNIYVNNEVIGQFSANQPSETSVDINFKAGTGISLEGNSQNGTITISAESNHTVINKDLILTGQFGMEVYKYEVRCDLNGSTLDVVDISDFSSKSNQFPHENKYVWTKTANQNNVYLGLCRAQGTEGKLVFKLDIFDSVKNKTNTHYYCMMVDTPPDSSFLFMTTCNWEITVRINDTAQRVLAYLKVPDDFVGTITLTPLRRTFSKGNEIYTFEYTTDLVDYSWDVAVAGGTKQLNTITTLIDNVPSTSGNTNYVRMPTGAYYVNVIGDLGGNLQVNSKVSDSIINDYYIHTIEKRLQDFTTAAAIYNLLNLPQPTAGDEGKILIVNSSGQYELIDPNNNTAQQ